MQHEQLLIRLEARTVNQGLDDLTHRERDTLSLLLQGHDAKSIARELNLSVFTINDRLRSARKKLGASSSREAARMFADSREADHQFLAHNEIGIAKPGIGSQPSEHVQHSRKRGRALIWWGGGLLVITLVLAVAVLAISQQGSAGLPAQTGPVTLSIGEAKSIPSASQWVILVDEANWTESWRSSGDLFRSQISQDQWAAAVGPVREPLGAMTSRTFKSATSTQSLPGGPSGEYEVVEFATDFANRAGATETVISVHEDSGWRVVGYFIR